MPEIRYSTSGDQKRLEQLRRQVYGKSTSQRLRSAGQQIRISSEMSTIRQSDNPTDDTQFLRQDLIKISILSSLALGVQILLFLSLKNGLVRLSF